MDEIDYPGLLITVAVCTLLAASGTLVDRFMLPLERTRLSKALAEWWHKVEATGLPDIPATGARAFIRVERAIFGVRLRPARFVLVTALISVSLTTTGLLAGDWTYWGNFEVAVRYFLENPRIPTYVVNYRFDFLTILITVFVMTAVLRWKWTIARIVILVIDALVAVVLAFIVYIVANSVEFWGNPIAPLGPEGLNIENVKLEMREFVSFVEMAGLFDWDSRWARSLASASDGWFSSHFNVGHRGWVEGGASSFFASITTLLPTLGWVALMVLVIAGMIVVRMIRTVFLRILKLDMDTDKSIFFYSGVLVGFLGIVGKVSIELTRLL